ncbi:unnamed protein product, partial [Polarella glacialis]
AMLQHHKPISGVKVDWLTSQAMTCSGDRSLLLWDLEACEPLQKFEKHPGSVWSMDVDWVGRRMVTGSGPGDNSVFLWDFSDGFLEKEITGHEGSVWAVSVDWESAHKAVERAAGIGIIKEDDD